MSWLSMPAFGLGREHQERLQTLARAQFDYQEKTSAYNALMMKAGQNAFERFEAKLGEREEPGRQLASARALFDLWIDAAEEAYAEIALSPEFRSAYGALVNAQMRLRSGIQREVELACGMFGMPTRSEMDAAHRKVAELERQLRRLRDANAPARASAPTVSRAKPDAAPKQKRAPAPKNAPAPANAESKNAPRSAKRPARAASRPARKTAPVSALAGIAAPMAPAAPSESTKKTAGGSKRR